MKKLFLIAFIFIVFDVTAQNYKIQTEFDQLLLQNSEGEDLDTLSLRYGTGKFWLHRFDTKNKKVKLYNAMHGTMPDNCPDYYLFQKTFSYATGKFELESKSSIEFDNAGCENYLDKTNLYCMNLAGFQFKGDSLYLSIEDSEERKITLKTSTAIFSKASVMNQFKKELSKFLLKPKCVLLRRENEKYKIKK